MITYILESCIEVGKMLYFRRRVCHSIDFAHHQLARQLILDSRIRVRARIIRVRPLTGSSMLGLSRDDPKMTNHECCRDYGPEMKKT